jgi:hypothetical protein
MIGSLKHQYFMTGLLHAVSGSKTRESSADDDYFHFYSPAASVILVRSY